jgi:protein-tyrosine phosphatase
VRVYEIIPGLYQAPTPQESEFLDGEGKRVDINAIIDLEGDIDPVVPQKEIGDVYVYWPIEDGPMAQPDIVRQLAGFVSGLVDGGYRVLVHCKSGINRASLVTARTLIHRGMEPEEAVKLLRERRNPYILKNKEFLDWLLREQPGT